MRDERATQATPTFPPCPTCGAAGAFAGPLIRHVRGYRTWLCHAVYYTAECRCGARLKFVQERRR